jgi:hypothetical protein
LQAALQGAEAIERRVEIDLVNQLIDAADTSRAVRGLDATLDALADERVQTLFLTDSFALQERMVDRAVAQGARIEIVSGDAAALLSEHGGIGTYTRF